MKIHDLLVVLLAAIAAPLATADRQPFDHDYFHDGNYRGSFPYGYTRGDDDAHAYLEPHNRARSEVGVEPLRWDGQAAAYARDYAERRRGDCLLVHSNSYDYGYGENIFVGTVNNKWTAGDAVGLWVAEKQYYDYSSNSCYSGDCGHYTQIVWSRTRGVGCARVECDGGGVFITCNYSPPGNIMGEWPF